MSIDRSCVDACLESKVAVFLGAGANAFLKFPLMEELTAEVRKSITTKIFSDLISACGDAADIEFILDYCYRVIDAGEVIRDNDVFRKILFPGLDVLPDAKEAIALYRALIDDINTSIFKVLRDVPIDNDVAFNQYNQFFSEFGRRIPESQAPRIIPVITTNYDCVIETIENTAPYIKKVVDGWEPDPKDRRNTVWFGHDRIPPPEGIRNIALFKMHGSLRWYRNRNDIHDLKYEPNPNALDLEIYAPLLVPPLMDKANEYEVHPIYGSLQADMERILSAAEIIVFVGYSFRDRRLNDIMHRSFLVNGKCRLVIIDSFPAIVEQNIQRGIGEVLAGRVEYVGNGFTEKINYRKHLRNIIMRLLNGVN